VDGRWEGTGCFCGYDEACTRSFREESQREKGALNARPKGIRRRKRDRRTPDYPRVSFWQVMKWLEGRFRRWKEQNEVRFNLGSRADWRRGGLRLHVRIGTSGRNDLGQLCWIQSGKRLFLLCFFFKNKETIIWPFNKLYTLVTLLCIHLYFFLCLCPWSQWWRCDSLFTMLEGLPYFFLPLRFACFDFPS
jgi:hypothetical protein